MKITTLTSWTEISVPMRTILKVCVKVQKPEYEYEYLIFKFSENEYEYKVMSTSTSTKKCTWVLLRERTRVYYVSDKEYLAIYVRYSTTSIGVSHGLQSHAMPKTSKVRSSV